MTRPSQASIKSPVFYTGGLTDYMHPGMQQGNVFYVNYGGDDTNDGLTPSRPFLTLTAAVAACTSDRHDLIVVLNWWLNEVCPIVLDKRMITIVGALSGSVAQPAIQIAADGDTDVFTFSERDIAIHNFILVAGATGAGVGYTAGAGMVRQGVYNCEFFTGQDGVRSLAVTAPANNCCVKDCTFIGSGLTRDGIRLAGNSAFWQLENNLFDALPGIGINVIGGEGAGRILDNRFMLPSNTQGKAITLGGTCVRWMVDGNTANYGVTTMVANPYEDSSGGAGNNWLTNWNGTAETDPA